MQWHAQVGILNDYQCNVEPYAEAYFFLLSMILEHTFDFRDLSRPLFVSYKVCKTTFTGVSRRYEHLITYLRKH